MTTYNTLLSLGQFKLHEYIFSQFQDRKLARNSVALLHALLTVIQNLLHISTPNSTLYNLCITWSSGYFVWDMLFIFQHEKLNILRLAYIYHHIVSIYIINQPPNLYFGDKFCFGVNFLIFLPILFITIFIQIPKIKNYKNGYIYRNGYIHLFVSLFWDIFLKMHGKLLLINSPLPWFHLSI